MVTFDLFSDIGKGKYAGSEGRLDLAGLKAAVTNQGGLLINDTGRKGYVPAFGFQYPKMCGSGPYFR